MVLDLGRYDSVSYGRTWLKDRMHTTGLSCQNPIEAD